VHALSIEIINESSYLAVDDEQFVLLARYVFEQLSINPDADLTVLFLDEDAMEQLHLDYMGLDGPTDVMSFPIDELTPGALPHHLQAKVATHQASSDEKDQFDLVLGDIAICPAIAIKQAEKAGHTANEEMLLLTVHGILHIIGHDHAEPAQKKIMFDLQRKLLIGFLASRKIGENGVVGVAPELIQIKGLPQ
jgi:probable rRNA maturation factor